MFKDNPRFSSMHLDLKFEEFVKFLFLIYTFLSSSFSYRCSMNKQDAFVFFLTLLTLLNF